MARKLFIMVALVAVVALAYAEEEKKEEKKDDVEGRIGFGSGYGHLAGGNQYGFNRGSAGFNQGSGGFDSANRFNNVQGFRNREGYRTNQGFDQTSFNRYGSGGGGFNTGFNRGAGGAFNQHGFQRGGYLG
nr:abscisic acid and environmental stress-inducible protein-like [Rhipicephalus microplus]